jgi:hypothetical protein
MFRPRFNRDSIRREMAERVRRVDLLILSTLQYVAETFIRDARENGNYQDQTGNLRSSIGFLILREGEVVLSSFPGQMQEGTAKAQQVAEQVARQFPAGYALVVVAGMEYAGYVEAKGYDVLTTSAQKAGQELRTQFGTAIKLIAA